MADALAIIADDKSGYLRPNGHHRGFGSSISVNLSHAKVAREKPPAPAAAARTPTTAAPLGRFLGDYAEIVELCRTQADKLEMSRHEIDRIAGLPEGHSGHVLALSFSKLIGPMYLLPLFETLGIRLIAVEDPELIARTLARRTPRCQSHLRVTRKLPPPPPQAASPPALTVVHGEQKRGGKYG
jgi:hypothetical protein